MIALYVRQECASHKERMKKSVRSDHQQTKKVEEFLRNYHIYKKYK